MTSDNAFAMRKPSRLLAHILVLTSVTGSLASAQDGSQGRYRKQPIPCGEEAHTWKKQNAGYFQWVSTVFQEQYRAHGHRDERWGGTHFSIFMLGMECVKTRRYDTGVPRLFWEAMRHIAMDESWQGAFRIAGAYRWAVKLSEGASDTPLTEQERLVYKTYQFIAAWSAKKHKDAAAILDELHDQLDESILKAYGMEAENLIRDTRKGVKRLGKGNPN